MPKRRGNGEGSVVRYKDKWRAIIVTGWRDETHPIRHTKVFNTAREAKEYIASYQGSSPPIRKTTVADYWSIYKDNGLQKLSPSKITHYNTVWRRIESIAHEDMRSLTVARLQDLVKGMTYYPSRDVKSLLSHLFKLAIADGVCSYNLSSAIVLPELHEEETVPFTAEEVEKMWLDYEKHPETGLALLMTYTGMMPSELKVKAEHIDLDHQRITWGIKTQKRRESSILIPDRLVPVVRQLLQNGKNGGLMPYKLDTYRKAFKEMVARIGANPRCTPYSCRHTFATMLSTQVSAHVLARLMRNDIRVTAKYYLHNDDDSLLQFANEVFSR